MFSNSSWRAFHWRPRLLQVLACLALACLGIVPTAQAAALYQIDQRYGTIGFTVSTLGLFDVEGSFPKFGGELLLDIRHPEQTRIDVAIDAGAVEMPLPDQVKLVRSPAYFDVAQYPRVRFVSKSIQPLSASHYLIHGQLEIRGITQPQDLDAVLEASQHDPASGKQVADIIVTGRIKRSAFGMVADRPLLSDDVNLRIRAHLTIDPSANAG